MSVLSKSLLALVSRHLVSLVLLSVGHNLMNFMVNNLFIVCSECVDALFRNAKIQHFF